MRGRPRADGVRKPKRVKVEMKVWGVEQLGSFLRASSQERLFPPGRLAAYTGMRRSELLGLRWEHCDLRAATVSVRRKRIDQSYGMVDELGSTSDSGVRVIDLDGHTMDVLRRWRRAQKRNVWPGEQREPVYQHVIPGMQAEAARAFAALVTADE